MKRLIMSVLLLAVVAVGLLQLGRFGIGPVVITREDEQKIVLFLSSAEPSLLNPQPILTEPGLSLRFPLLTDVRVFDRRYLYLNTEPLPIQTRDEERLVVDNYVIWRIRDPLLFFKSFPTGPAQAESQIDRVVRADVREVIGRRTFGEVVTSARRELMRTITEQSDRSLRAFGIEVRDVRINRTELPAGTEQNVYARMRAERQRLARKYRAEGEEEGRRIRAEAERKARVTLAEAERDAEILRGEGDAKAAAIHAEAYQQAPAFYTFWRSLEAYRKTLSERTTLVVSPEHEFFKPLMGE